MLIKAAFPKITVLTGSSAQAVAPFLVIVILAMMLLPLPPFLLDALFTFNIAVSVLVLLAAMRIKSFKDFIAFPTILLITTLLRLSLNVASTRVVLAEGHQGTDAAGAVIQAFGEFLIGGNFAIGIIVFLVITLINFMVITKGAGRVAEVSARFALDALPGKQMAIDADLNAGIIKEDEARKRRLEVGQEADFYGSMDGASKFVRGDAIAGIIILFVNLIGGLIVGMSQRGMGIGQAVEVFGTLTIGDGLVAQVPALIISTAAGILVTRVATDEDLSGQMSQQFANSGTSLYLVGGILFVLGVLPGMPHIAFLSFAAIFLSLGYVMSKRVIKQEAEAAAAAAAPPQKKELDWSDVPVVEPLCLELPYRLIPLVDKGDESDLIKRIRAIRRKFVSEVGFLTPSVHIRDNLQLPAETYRVLLFGAEIGRGQCLPDKLLAIEPSDNVKPLAGVKVKDPTYGMPAVWIDRTQRDDAMGLGYTVVEPAVVVTTHLDQLIRSHSQDLLGRQETQDLIEHYRSSYPKLIEDVVPKVVTVATLQKILQLLLEEDVPVKDLRTILEVASENPGLLSDPVNVLSPVRYALRRTITQEVFGEALDFKVLGLHPDFDRLIEQAVGNQAAAPEGAIEPSLARFFGEEVMLAVNEMAAEGLNPVLITSGRTRLTLSRLARRVKPEVTVLSMSELPPNGNIAFFKVLCNRTAAQAA
ncbi:flagellar biosynthesis protein FlhA [Betaproteobacteria bacterium LSUCC0115]|nr:flagellar biosynthesis protein FlhA [Burkholderiales bacterium LSUCC0115]